MFKVGDRVRRTSDHKSKPKEHPLGYVFEIAEMSNRVVYDSDGECHHKGNLVKVQKRVTNKSKQYSFVTQHKAKFSLHEVEISREYPYALIQIEEESRKFNCGVYFHNTLYVKAVTLGLPLPEDGYEAINGNGFAPIFDKKDIGKTLKVLNDIINAPWPAKSKCTVKVKLYPGEVV